MPAQPFPPPRQWMEEPELFGKGSGRADWKQPMATEDAFRIRGARMQHRLAIQIRRRIQDNKTSAAAVAAQIGVSADMLNDALNGYTHLHVTTLDAIHHVFGLRLKVDVEPEKQPPGR